MKTWPIAAAFAGLVVSGTMLGGAASPPPRWWAPGDGRIFPAQVDYDNPDGSLRVILEGGPMATKGHPSLSRAAPPVAHVSLVINHRIR